jgi:hypothetical protein
MARLKAGTLLLNTQELTTSGSYLLLNGLVIGRAITGTPDGTKFLRDDYSWQTPPGGGGGLTQPQVMARNLGC